MSKQWLLYKNGQQSGPFSEDQLRQQLMSGAVTPNDSVWTEGMSQWVPAGQVQSLSGGGAPSAAGPPGYQQGYPQQGYQQQGYQQQGYGGGYGGYGGPSAGGKGKGGLIAVIAIVVIALGVGGYFLWPMLFGGGDLQGAWQGSYMGDALYVRFDKDTATMLEPSWGEYYETAYRTRTEGDRNIVEYYDNWSQEYEPFFIYTLEGRDTLILADYYYPTDRVTMTKMSDSDFNNMMIGLRKVDW